MINQYLLAGFVQSSTVASGGPRWWSVNNTMKPTTTFHPHHHHHQYHHHQFTESSNLAPSSWNDDNPQPWNQALVGGLMFADEDTYKLQSSRIHTMQENNIPPLNPPAGLIIPIQNAKTTKSLWYRHQMIHSPSSDAKPCISTISCLNDNNKLDDDGYAHHISSNGKRPRNESPYSPESKSNAKGGSAAKKARVIQHPLDQSTFKVRKEKLGDRITALHQIVSPFGKTDTASVLLESIGYIRFLQNQIEALSLPYLNCAKSKSMRQQHTGISDEEEQKKDLRSRGLCLVPIECTFHVGGDNMGADYWASAFSAR